LIATENACCLLHIHGKSVVEQPPIAVDYSPDGHSARLPDVEPTLAGKPRREG
jgi:Tol biopolymer transport system component